MYLAGVSDDMEELERRIDKLRSEVRRATVGGDRVRARQTRAELREAERRWDEALAKLDDEPAGAEQSAEPESAAPRTAMSQSAASGSAASRSAASQSAMPRAGALLPARDQVHQALTLLGAPAAPRLIVAVHEAFYAGKLPGARLTSLRRDEERSFRAAPFARPYYLCAALTADLLAPVRGLLAVSTWPMDRRIIGPLSPRVDYLTAAIGLAERLQRAPDAAPAAQRLLWRFAANIPRAAASFRTMSPEDVVRAARAELAVHQDDDSVHRAAAARRARTQLDDAEQLFGTGLRVSHQADAGA